jgi:peptide deformylase
MKKIVQREEKVLRKVAKEVPVKEITSPKIQKILKEMSAALKTQDDGVAIAAPQIGYSLQIFVISGKIFHKDFIRGEILPKDAQIPKDLIFINPKISKLSKEKDWMPEGCLSVRWAYGEVYRSKKCTVTAYNEYGKKFTRGASGLLAQAFQHETDHLNGVLFIDKAENIKEEEI